MAGSWFWFPTRSGAAGATTSATTTTSSPPTEIKSPNQNQAAPTVKPCCVCKDEKATRDECLLFTSSPTPEKECATTIDAYRTCMKGFGFELP